MHARLRLSDLHTAAVYIRTSDERLNRSSIGHRRNAVYTSCVGLKLLSMTHERRPPSVPEPFGCTRSCLTNSSDTLVQRGSVRCANAETNVFAAWL